MTPSQAIAFLIDADNLNDPDAVAEAFEHLHRTVGVSTIRRAYGSTDSLRGLSPVLKRHAVRPCANFVLEKNTTDMALAVDAMEIACQAEPPAVIALGSGDTDFYPLVVRLRERGVRVIVYSLPGKMADDMAAGCPELCFVGAPARTPKSGRKSSDPPTDTPVARKSPATRKTPAAKKAATAPKPPQAGRAVPTLDQILAAVPGLQTTERLHLNDVTKLLKAAALLGRNASSVKLLARFPGAFELTPQSQPNYVKWIQRD